MDASEPMNPAACATTLCAISKTPHSVRQRKGQLVRLWIAQADRQASLRVSVDQQDFLSRLRQTDSKIGTGGGFANAAFLVGDGDDLRVH